MAAKAPSMLGTLVQVELAGALAVTGVLWHQAELSLKQAENLAEKLMVVAREPPARQGEGWKMLFAEAAADYRDYVRGLAASPGLVAMSFLDHLDRLRQARSAPDRPGGGGDGDRSKE